MQNMVSSAVTFNPNQVGIVKGFAALSEFRSGLINLLSISMNQQGSKFF